MKKILVVSFQRSGTHFLINNLSTNFENIEDGWIDVIHNKENQWVKNVERDNLQEKIKEQLLEAYYPHPINKCVKTHYQAYYFERYLDEIAQKYDIFYIIRDPRDVMIACYHYYNNTNYERFIKESVFSKFIRKELWNVPTETKPFSYSYIKPRNIIDKWCKHVASWLPYRNKAVTFVHFSDLKVRPHETLLYLASRSQQRLKQTIQPVTIQDKRYRPDFIKPGLKRGIVGTWKSYFSSDDLNFLEDIVPEYLRQISYS